MEEEVRTVFKDSEDSSGLLCVPIDDMRINIRKYAEIAEEIGLKSGEEMPQEYLAMCALT